MAADRIGPYELIEHLANGGMGRVYLARSSGIGEFERYVVVKTLDTTTHGDPQYVTMFLDEARVLGKLHHQHIAPVFELGRENDGRYYLVMDYVHGRNAYMAWQRALELGAALPLDFAVTVVAAVASALAYAHTRRRDGKPLGIVHRDVSMSNVMLGYDGAIKLIDFGIAKAADRETRTQAGYVKGKLGCLAPEQVGGGTVDHRTDIFALGILLYELTTMTRAFRERNDLATLERVARANYAPPSRVVAGYPHELELIIAKALQVDPEARFQEADAMRRELEAFGHRHRLVLGDAAVSEVMEQLFEQRLEPWQSSTRAQTDLALPIEADEDDPATIPVQIVRSGVRRLRAATDFADQMEIEVSTAPEEEHKDAPAAKIEPNAPMPRAPRRSRVTPVIISLIVAGLGIGGGLGGRALGDDAEAVPPPPLPHIEPAPVAPIAAPTPPPAPAVPAPAPTVVQLKITTSPNDATILLDGVRLGHTPYEGAVPASDGLHVLKIRRHGYVPRKLEVELSSDVAREVTLTPLGSS
jgi:serine/threonine protein kinase